MRAAETYEELRPLLFSIAYRMLGSVAEAEDIVQEAFLRYHALEDTSRIDSPKAYLSAVTTRLAIDQLRSARVRRETYPGQGLPEPVVAGLPAGVAMGARRGGVDAPGQRLENWKLRRALARPYFLRSTARLSRVSRWL